MHAIAAQPGSADPILRQCDPPRAPAAGEVLCRTVQLGICGTDREILLSRSPLVPPGEPDLILGHECLAQVLEIGSEVSTLRAGDLVVPLVRRPRAGALDRRPDMLPFGQYTERGIVQEHGFSQPLWLDQTQYLLPVPPEVADLAVLTEPLSVAEKGINEALLITEARLGAGAWTEDPPRVLVTGMGPIGYAALLGCLCRGWRVTLYGRDEPDSERAELVRRLGGDYLPAAFWKELDDDQVQEHGYDLVLECTGSDEVMLRTAQSLRSCGILVWLGSSRIPEPATRNVDLMMRTGVLRNHVHLGCVNSAARDFQEALKHLAQMRQKNPQALNALVTDQVTLDEALWHYQHRRPQGIKTVVIYPELR